MEDELEEQIRLKDDFEIFKESTKPNFKDTIIFLNGKREVFNAFENVIFLKGKQTQRKGLPSSFTCLAKFCDHKQIKILTPKQMFQRLPVALALIKRNASNHISFV